MSSTVQCQFPILPTFKPPTETLTMPNLLSSAVAATSSAVIPGLPPLTSITPNSTHFLENFLNTQQIDPIAYFQALSQTAAVTSFSAGARLPEAGTTLQPQLPASSFSHLLSNISDRNILTQQKITKRRNRTTFTHEQATALEKEYSVDQYMPRSRRALVAENLCLTEGQVKTWFQNRRAKDKRTDKLNGIQQADPTSVATISAGEVSPTIPQRSIVSGIGSGPRPLKPMFDTNFLMPPMNGGVHSTPSPSSSATSSIHSPLSPLSPLFGSNNSLNFAGIDSNSSAATLAALYMQALQLQTSMASTVVSS